MFIITIVSQTSKKHTNQEKKEETAKDLPTNDYRT